MRALSNTEVYCRKCRDWHQIRRWVDPFSNFHVAEDCYCPKRGQWRIVMKHESTGRPVPV